MPNAIKGVRDYRNTTVYHLKAVIPGVNVTVTMLTPGSQPTASASVADDGTVTVTLGIPSTMGIKDVSISQDGIITITMDDDSTETFDGMKTAITAATQATTDANNAASSATQAARDANTAAGNANDATTAATNAAAAANNAAQTALASVGNMLIGEYADTTGGQMFTTEDAYATGTLHGLTVYGKSTQESTTGKNLFNSSSITWINGYRDPNGNIVIGSSHHTSPIPVDGDTQYTINGTLSSGSSASWALYYLDSQENWLEKVLLASSQIPNTFTTPANCRFIQIQVVNDITNLNDVQLEKGSSATEYEPYTGGIPAPSPDYQQEIKSVADGSVWLSGKNLFDVNNKAETTVKGVTSSYDSSSGIFLANGTIEGTGQYDFNFSLKNHLICPSNSTLVFSFDGQVTLIGLSSVVVFLYDVKSMSYFEYHTINTNTSKNAVFTNAGDKEISNVLLRIGSSQETRTINFNTHIQLEYGNNVTNYVLPLSYKTLDFLPAGIEPLRSLPDGTRDVLRIDKDGNGVIERNVGKFYLKNKPNWSMTVYGNFNRFSPQSTIPDAIKITARTSNVFSDYFLHSSDPVSNPAKSNTIALYNALPYILADMELYPDVASFKALIDDIDPILLYQLSTPTTETIHASVMPQIPSEYLNAWLDASDQNGNAIDPAWGMEYERGITIVVNSIESAIADIVTGE